MSATTGTAGTAGTAGTVQMVRTARGAEVQVYAYGPPDGQPLLYLHAATGLLDDDRYFAALGQAGWRVWAPEWPGYGASTGETLLEDMLDFTLHGWDVADALDLEHPVLVGHSMGGMIAAEMAALCPKRPAAVILVAPNGLWDPARPLPDLFALLPFQFADVLFADPAAGAALLTGGLDFTDMSGLTDFFIGNSRRLGTAGKILFPIPNRRLSKRLYRLRAPTLLAWGSGDSYIPPAYAEQWQALVPHAQLAMIEGSGHMVPYEQPDALAAVTGSFLDRSPSPWA